MAQSTEPSVVEGYRAPRTLANPPPPPLSRRLWDCRSCSLEVFAGTGPHGQAQLHKFPRLQRLHGFTDSVMLCSRCPCRGGGREGLPGGGGVQAQFSEPLRGWLP